MKVLIACEFSGRVREAFRIRGHEAWSCDLRSTEQPGPHIVNDVRNVLDWGWDLMIAHPDCTHLTASGARWWPNKQHEQAEALRFVELLLRADIPHIAIENPVGIISTAIRKPDQIIQPFQFGDPESKKTCLWLKNLPLLQATNILALPECGYWNNQTPTHQNKLTSARSKDRAVTYQGIAQAMAEQWGGIASDEATIYQIRLIGL